MCFLGTGFVMDKTGDAGKRPKAKHKIIRNRMHFALPNPERGIHALAGHATLEPTHLPQEGGMRQYRLMCRGGHSKPRQQVLRFGERQLGRVEDKLIKDV